VPSGESEADLNTTDHYWADRPLKQLSLFAGAFAFSADHWLTCRGNGHAVLHGYYG
jgi:hypothetical protein